MPLQIEFEFVLPKGYVDENGELHKNGVMRLATAADEILPMKDPRVLQNPSYLTVIIMARVITKLGNLQDVNTRVVEGLFSADLSYLQELYQSINGTGSMLKKVVCPKCEHSFDVEVSGPGEE